jgi:hypothetical protein
MSDDVVLEWPTSGLSSAQKIAMAVEAAVARREGVQYDVHGVNSGAVAGEGGLSPEVPVSVSGPPSAGEPSLFPGELSLDPDEAETLLKYHIRRHMAARNRVVRGLLVPVPDASPATLARMLARASKAVSAGLGDQDGLTRSLAELRRYRFVVPDNGDE